MEKLKLYHGSCDIIKEPVFGIGNVHNDYGLAFYCTENIELAKEWAVNENRDGYANYYLINTEGLRILNLNSGEYNILNWLAMLMENRTFRVNTDALRAREYLLENFLPDYKSYDVIKGYRADDSYFSFANAFLNNAISMDKLTKVMKLGNLGEQIAIKSEEAFKQLQFIDSELVRNEIYYVRKKARDDGARMQFQNEKSELTESVYLIDIIRQQWREDDERIQRIIY